MIKGIAIIILVAVLDQWSKNSIIDAFNSQALPMEITSFFSLVLAWNPGISFGMFNDLAYTQWIFSGIATVISLFLLSWMRKAETLFLVSSLALVIGGAIGNTIDRLRYGAVVDFLDIYIGSYHWPAFNVADSAIFIGVGMLILDGALFNKEKEVEKQEKDAKNQ